MLNSILYFEQFCIKNFEKLEDEFLKNPENFAEYVFGITDLLCKFGNGLIAKMVCVYEGKEEETIPSRRRILTNRHYFCGVNSGEANLQFWDDIHQYLENNYDLDQVKKIYLNADGCGVWKESTPFLS